MNAQREVRLAERVWETWYGFGLPGDDAVATGVVAAMTLFVQEKDGPDLTKVYTVAPDDYVIKALKEIWSFFWLVRPDLAMRVGPYADWLNEDALDPGKVRACAAVARTAAKQGVFHMDEVDVIGTVYTMGRSDSAKQARGEYYTPLPVCQLMAEMTMPDLQPGQSINDPCAGHGGMFLGAATALRRRDADPADFTWIGNDISPISVAGLAVNAHRWGLGRNVIIGCADTLREPDWITRAVQEQNAAIDQRNHTVQAARMLAVLRHVEGLVNGEPASGDGDETAPHLVPVAPIEPPADPTPAWTLDSGDLFGQWCGRCGKEGHTDDFCPNDEPTPKARIARVPKSRLREPADDAPALF